MNRKLFWVIQAIKTEKDTAMGGLFGAGWKWKLSQFPLLENCKMELLIYSKLHLQKKTTNQTKSSGLKNR